MKNEIAQFDSTISRVNFGSGRELSGPKSTDQDFDSSIIVSFLEIFLDLIFGSPKNTIGTKVLDWVSPDVDNIERTRAVAPEGKGDVVVESVICVTWDSDTTSNFLRRPPLGDSVNVNKPDGVVDFGGNGFVGFEVLEDH